MRAPWVVALAILLAACGGPSASPNTVSITSDMTDAQARTRLPREVGPLHGPAPLARDHELRERHRRSPLVRGERRRRHRRSGQRGLRLVARRPAGARVLSTAHGGRQARRRARAGGLHLSGRLGPLARHRSTAGDRDARLGHRDCNRRERDRGGQLRLRPPCHIVDAPAAWIRRRQLTTNHCIPMRDSPHQFSSQVGTGGPRGTDYVFMKGPPRRGAASSSTCEATRRRSSSREPITYTLSSSAR